MDELLTALETQFKAIGLKFRVEQVPYDDGAYIYVDDIRMRIYRRGRATVIFLGRAFRRPYDVGKMVTYFLSRLPELMKTATEDRERRENMDLAKDLAEAHKDDTRLTIGYSGNGEFFVSFKSFYTDVAVLADKLREWNSDPDAKPPPKPEMRFAMLNEKDELGESFDVFTALKYVYLEDLDDIPEMPIGGIYARDDLRMQRVQ